MAARGASNSVITQTTISEELQVSLLLHFSLRGGGFCSAESCFYSQHNIIHSALAQSPEDCRRVHAGWPSVMRRGKNGRGNLSFHFTWQRWCSFNISPQNRRDGTFHSQQSCTHTHIHIYIGINTHIHTCSFVPKEKRQFCKSRTCSGLIAVVLFSFIYPLRCSPNTVDLNEEKSLMTPCPSNLIKLTWIYVSIWMSQSVKDLQMFDLNYFSLSVCICYYLSRQGLSCTSNSLKKMDREMKNLLPLVE